MSVRYHSSILLSHSTQIIGSSFSGGLFLKKRKRVYQCNTGALITHVYNLWARARFFPECSHATFLIYLSKKNNKNFFIAIFFVPRAPFEGSALRTAQGYICPCRRPQPIAVAHTADLYNLRPFIRGRTTCVAYRPLAVCSFVYESHLTATYDPPTTMRLCVHAVP